MSKLLQPNTKEYWEAVATHWPLLWIHVIPLMLVVILGYAMYEDLKK